MLITSGGRMEYEAGFRGLIGEGMELRQECGIDVMRSLGPISQGCDFQRSSRW